MVDGFGACSSSQTEKTVILSPEDWAAKKSGPGYWISVEEVAKQKVFTLQICEKSGMCGKDTQKEIKQKFDLFLNKPQELADKINKAKMELK